MRPKIRIQDYSYKLPEERIAKYPLKKRDDSKLLIFNNHNISETKFATLPSLLPKESIMVFNNTKVVPARLLFKKPTGAIIEIFCLEPVEPAEYATAFASKNECIWNVVIGNLKRWKSDILDFFCDAVHADAYKLHLKAELVSKKENNGSIVRFTWDTSASFSEVLDICGKIPIPPYLKRETEELDKERYQTLYARIKGSVAAPTAGLHFTNNVLNEIHNVGIKTMDICLHVGAGTFVPVKSEYISDHKMHTEPFSISLENLVSIASKPESAKIIAVGTTSMRTLESLYYLGCQYIKYGVIKEVQQWEPYDENYDYSVKQSINALIDYMKTNHLDRFVARTGIIIVPSYKFKLVNILVTNFHQPQSTLLLLIAAFVGDDWKNIYDYALNNDFRFLSYGDSSVLFRKDL